MEGLIIFAVMALLSFFFSGDKKEKNKPLRKAQKGGRVGDLMTQMKDKMEQIEAETKPLSKRQEQAKKLAQQAKSRVQELAEQNSGPYDKPLQQIAKEARQQSIAVPEKVRVKSMRELREDVQPTERAKKRHPLLATKHDAQRAILLAEVLGPPKSKRK